MKKKKREPISKTDALRSNAKRSDASRALDAVRKGKKVAKKPTKQWAKDPARSDVNGIDDGSKRAKQRNATAIKSHFGKIGRRGAAKTNARNANRMLTYQTISMKTLLEAKRADPQSPEIQKRIIKLKKQMAKNQAIAAKWQKGFA